jgi:hypothetical protein
MPQPFLNGRPIGDFPVPGFYEIRLVRKGPFVPARIVHEDGLWSAVINGQESHKNADPYEVPMIHRIWPCERTITEDRYAYLNDLRVWAIANDPKHPAANPRTPIDLTELKPLWS